MVRGGLGDAGAVRRAVLEAERHYERFRTGEEPPWLGFYTEAGFATDLGRCLRTGDADRAAKLITRALDSVEPWKVSGRCAIQTDIAITHLLGRRDLEQAAAHGRDALRTTAEVSSTRTLDGLRTLQRQVRSLCSASPHLADLDERITDFVTRTTRRHQQDNEL